MMDPEKIQEIKKQLRKGCPEGEIKEALRKEGFTQVEIDLAFTPHHYDMRSWYLISGIIVFMIGMYFFLKEGGLLLLILSGLLFFCYLREIKRLEKLNRNKN